jgi:hypothetical protein
MVLVSLDEFFRKYEILMELSPKHPAFVSNFNNYLVFISKNLAVLGKKGNEMFDNLFGRVVENKQVDVFVSMFVELNRLKRANEILLKNAPLVNYLFARALAIKFVKEVKESDFFDIAFASLFKNEEKFEKALYVTFRCFDDFEDKFEFYPIFRRSLLLMFGNGILSRKDVEKYVPVVERFEKEIEEVEDSLRLVSGTESMSAFGGRRLKADGAVSGEVLVEFFRRGSEFLEEMSKSDRKEDFEVWKGLVGLMTVRPYDPVCDFILDKQLGTRLIFHHVRKDVFLAINVCQSMVNLFTPDLLVQTALSDYYDIVMTGRECDVDALIERTSRNLALLREQGIINVETQQDFIDKMRKGLTST